MISVPWWYMTCFPRFITCVFCHILISLLFDVNELMYPNDQTARMYELSWYMLPCIHTSLHPPSHPSIHPSTQPSIPNYLYIATYPATYPHYIISHHITFHYGTLHFITLHTFTKFIHTYIHTYIQTCQTHICIHMRFAYTLQYCVKGLAFK